MPSLLSISRALLLLGIYISNIVSIVILRMLIFASTTGTSVVLSVVSSIFALLVFPIALTRGRISERIAEVGNTRYLITFGALCLLDLPSCITLPLRALQDNGTALCQDLSQSSDCTSAHVVIGCYFTAVIFAIIGFVITCIDRCISGTPKVSPRYPTARYPHEVELDDVFPAYATGKAKQALAERSAASPV